MDIGVHKVAMDSPADTSKLEALILEGILDPTTIVACIGKTEGNGGANDFTRGLATLSYQMMLEKHIGYEQSRNIAFVWSGGTEGVLSPHATFFTRRERADADGSHSPGLVLSIQTTPELLPEQVGRAAMVEAVAKATKQAMADAGVVQADEVHYVQVKGPLLTSAGIRAANSRGNQVVTQDPNLSKGYARGAMALGVAVALGEIQPPELGWDEVINKDMSLFSRVASTSAGGELTCCEVILMANTKRGTGSFAIGHSQLQDALDTAGILQAVRAAGMHVDALLDDEQRSQIVSVFAKAEASAMIRGCRTTMFSDADIHYERHARAAVGAVISSIIGNTRIFVSGGTEHQCLSGSAPIAVIVRKPS